MNQYFGELVKQTNGRKLYDITNEIVDWVNQQPVSNGLLTLNIQHTSASLLVNENYDYDVQIDLDKFFSKIVIDGDDIFSHTAEGDDDMPAHIRTALTQTNLSIPILLRTSSLMPTLQLLFHLHPNLKQIKHLP